MDGIERSNKIVSVQYINMARTRVLNFSEQSEQGEHQQCTSRLSFLLLLYFYWFSPSKPMLKTHPAGACPRIAVGPNVQTGTD